VLQELEAANAFVASLDAGRSWFRYHHLFADLLQLELRRTTPGEVTRLHQVAAQWFSEHGFPVEAIRHAQAARDWGTAARLLAGHWSGLHLGGQAATVHTILAGFPAGAAAADAELAAVAAADELARGSLEAAERYLEVAARGAASVPAPRRGQAEVLFGIVRLLVARQRGNAPAVAEEARRLQAAAEAPESAPGLGEELRALALVSLGSAEFWAARFEDAAAHLEQGAVLARRVGRPYLEFTGLAYQAPVELERSFARAAERGRQAVELAERHGWTEEPAAGSAYMALAAVLIRQGRPDEAEPWVQRAERAVSPETEPAAGAGVRYLRGLLELARGHDADALAAFQSAERLSARLAAPHGSAFVVTSTRAWRLHALVRLGAIDRAEQTLGGLRDEDRDRGEIRVAEAMLRLAQDDPRAATATLAPVLDGSALVPWPNWLVSVFVLEAIVRDSLSDRAAAWRALERALDIAEPDRMLFPFLLYRAPGLLERHAQDCAKHAALISEILTLLPAGHGPGGHRETGGLPVPGAIPADRPARVADHPRALIEPVTRSEMRVLRYLPTNLSAPEIARELSVSVTTVRTHISHLFAKLGAHRRTEAVARARDLGLLAPSPVRRAGQLRATVLCPGPRCLA
jgi:LuxR family maltose regulon positive regulatory protein